MTKYASAAFSPPGRAGVPAGPGPGIALTQTGSLAGKAPPLIVRMSSASDFTLNFLVSVARPVNSARVSVPGTRLPLASTSRLPRVFRSLLIVKRSVRSNRPSPSLSIGTTAVVLPSPGASATTTCSQRSRSSASSTMPLRSLSTPSFGGGCSKTPLSCAPAKITLFSGSKDSEITSVIARPLLRLCQMRLALTLMLDPASAANLSRVSSVSVSPFAEMLTIE